MVSALTKEGELLLVVRGLSFEIASKSQMKKVRESSLGGGGLEKGGQDTEIRSKLLQNRKKKFESMPGRR